MHRQINDPWPGNIQNTRRLDLTPHTLTLILCPMIVVRGRTFVWLTTNYSPNPMSVGQ